MLLSHHHLFETYRYGIVDANLREELLDHWPQQVIAPGYLGSDTSRSPVLLKVDTLSREDTGALLDRLETETRERRAVFFSLLVETDTDLQRATNHLASRLVVKLEPNARPMQFRYFDPGTFVQLPSLLGEVGMNWLLGPIKAVMVPWAGEFRRYEKTTATSTGFSLSPYLPALLDVSIVNRAAMQLDPPVNQKEWVDRCGRIRKHVQRARENHGLSERDDLVAFALHAEICHPSFDEHRIIRALLDRLSKAMEEDQLDYRELTIGVATETWKMIARELTRNESTKGISS